MGRLIIFMALIIIMPSIFLIMGCMQTPGESKTIGIDRSAKPDLSMIGGKKEIIQSTQKWLDSLEADSYPISFKGCSAGEPILVYTKDKKPYTWVVPVKNRENFYMGYVNAFHTFAAPGSFTVYKQPHKTLFTTSAEQATERVLKENPKYNRKQIREPILILKETGWYWYIESVTGEIFWVHSY